MTVPQEASTTTPADTNIDMAVLHTQCIKVTHVFSYTCIYTEHLKE